MADGNGLDQNELQSPGGTALTFNLFGSGKRQPGRLVEAKFYTMIVLSGEKILTISISTLVGVLCPTYICGILVAL